MCDFDDEWGDSIVEIIYKNQVIKICKFIE
jgi:hypothetical protein